MLKVSIAYFYGYKAVGTLVYSWPEAYDKAQRRRPDPARSGSRTSGSSSSRSSPSTSASTRPTARWPGPPHPDIAEVQLRIGVRAPDKAPVERFTREIAPLVLTGPPSVTGFAGGRPEVQEVVAYWPALIDRDRDRAARARCEVLDA